MFTYPQAYVVPNRELKDRMGIPYLQRVLNRELSTHIERSLPDLMSCLAKKKKSAEEQLNKLQQTVEANNVLDR